MSRLVKLGSDPKRPITIAVLAMGGQGGGVLVDWIVNLAEHNGYLAQSTSVPGVAQRTGSTIYYIELFSQQFAQAKGQAPVFAMMPVPGDVDLVIASELMEAGRAMLRGLVTPDRTTLIASSHREFATVEKVVPGNGMADTQAVMASAHKNAQRFLHDDMQALARDNGSVISAALFGALAGSEELPFDDAAFAATIERAGVGVQGSLRALGAGAASIRQPLRAEVDSVSMGEQARALPAKAASAAMEPLRQRIVSEFAAPVHAMLGEGLQRVVEFQDIRYGNEYLDRMAVIHGVALQAGDAQHAYVASIEAARWVAVAMAYDDVIRVADLKTRLDRTQRVRSEIGAQAGDVVGTTEYFHPRLEEIYGLMPSSLVRRIESLPWLRGQLVKRIGEGRRIRPHTLTGLGMLRTMASLRRWRRSSQRHAVEMKHLEHWLQCVQNLLRVDHALGLETIRCRRLVKGYSDTHARGSSKFDRLLQAAQQLRNQSGAGATLATLRDLALSDFQGDKLDAMLAGISRGMPQSPVVLIPGSEAP